MNHVMNLCLIRQEEWWTYELCFKHGIRQFHLQAEVTRTRATEGSNSKSMAQQMTITTEFSLGTAPNALYSSETDLNGLVSGGYRPKSSKGRTRNQKLMQSWILPLACRSLYLNDPTVHVF